MTGIRNNHTNYLYEKLYNVVECNELNTFRPSDIKLLIDYIRYYIKSSDKLIRRDRDTQYFKIIFDYLSEAINLPFNVSKRVGLYDENSNYNVGNNQITFGQDILYNDNFYNFLFSILVLLNAAKITSKINKICLPFVPEKGEDPATLIFEKEHFTMSVCDIEMAFTKTMNHAYSLHDYCRILNKNYLNTLRKADIPGDFDFTRFNVLDNFTKYKDLLKDIYEDDYWFRNIKKEFSENDLLSLIVNPDGTSRNLEELYNYGRKIYRFEMEILKQKNKYSNKSESLTFHFIDKMWAYAITCDPLLSFEKLIQHIPHESQKKKRGLLKAANFLDTFCIFELYLNEIAEIVTKKIKLGNEDAMKFLADNVTNNEISTCIYSAINSYNEKNKEKKLNK